MARSSGPPRDIAHELADREGPSEEVETADRLAVAEIALVVELREERREPEGGVAVQHGHRAGVEAPGDIFLRRSDGEIVGAIGGEGSRGQGEAEAVARRDIAAGLDVGFGPGLIVREPKAASSGPAKP